MKLEILFFLLDEYEWKYDGCFLPPDEELVIYEIHVGDFSGGENDPNARGTFTNVTKKIEYLKDLGVNASMYFLFHEKNQMIFCYLVELMPIKEYPGTKNIL
jgi:1,4-alpha-glucan branching enzyme